MPLSSPFLPDFSFDSVLTYGKSSGNVSDRTNIYTHAHTALGGAKTGIPLTPRQCGRDLAGKGVPQEEEDLLSGRARQGMDPALCKGTL